MVVGLLSGNIRYEFMQNWEVELESVNKEITAESMYTGALNEELLETCYNEPEIYQD